MTAPLTLLLLVATTVGALLGLGGAALMLSRAGCGRITVDEPDARRLHTTPTPRGGGLGIVVAGLLASLLASLVALCLAPSSADARLVAIVVWAWALPNGLLGILDDRRPLPARAKLTVQVAAALCATGLGLRLDLLALPPFPALALPVALAWFASVVWLIWIANGFNFMDGMDALAAPSGALFASGLTLLALAANLPLLAITTACTGGALLGFLRYNWPPARIFMGDGGSLFAGALFGGSALALATPAAGSMPLAAPLLLLGPFIWDTTFTLLRRAVRREPLMTAHRTHLYQRLVLAGWPQSRVRALYLLLALAGLAAALALAVPQANSRPHGLHLLVLLGAVTAAGALAIGTHLVERRAVASSPTSLEPRR